MKIRKPIGLLGGALICGLSTVALADTAPTTSVEQMATELKALRAEVAQLKADKGDNWLNERRAEEVKSLVREVLSDADTRASLMSNGMTAGHNGKRFFLASEDGTFLLQAGGQIQVRYVADLRNDFANPTNTSANTVPAGDESGFQMRRIKLFFDGFIGDPKLMYKIQLAADRDTTTVQAEEAWIAYNLLDNVKVWGGRFQDTFAREAIMSSKNQQTVERSAVANIFANNDNYVEGVGVEWKASDALKVSGTFSDGMGSGNVSGAAAEGLNGVGKDFMNDDVDFAVTGRVDTKLSGSEWAQADDVEAWSNIGDDAYLFVGGAGHFEKMKSQVNSDQLITGLTTATYPVSSFVQWTADGLFKYQGFSLMAAGYGWYFQDRNGPNSSVVGDFSAYAATIQGGYFIIPDRLEPFARYEYINVNKLGQLNSGTLANDQHILTFGANYFFRKHNAKFTLDCVWALNNINALNTMNTSLKGVGLQNDASGNTGRSQVAIRAQFQLLF